VNRTGRVVAVALGVVVAIGVVLRFVTRSDLWLDEALTVNIAHLPFRDIAPWLKHDGAPPLYYWMLHFWESAFGTGDVAARSLSGVIGVLTLPAAWWAGRRIGGTRLAWLAVLVLAVNPFAIRYATEARMYELVVLFVFLGIVAVRAAVARPRPLQLLAVAAISAGLVWTHYWTFGLIGATVVVLALVAWTARDAALRRSALLTGAAVIVGAATLVGWAATLRYQSQHTGTPWATAQFPTGPIYSSIFEFAGSSHPEGWLLVYPAVVLLVVGVFAVAARGFTVELDAHGHSEVQWEALVGALGIGFAATLAWVQGSGFQPRYAAIVLPFFVLLVARGIAVLDDVRLRAGAIVLVVVCGLVGGYRNVTENRTQAAAAASVIAADAKPGDVVVYCPDQLGPATHRTLARTDLRQVKYPLDPERDPRVGLIDWVDYTDRLAANPPNVAAQRVLQLAGNKNIFVVTAPGYITHDVVCPEFLDQVAEHGHRTRKQLLAPDPQLFEKAGVVLLAPRA
jgi:hypothetical protein